MRLPGLAVSAVLLLALSAPAQTTPPAAPAAPTPERLDQLLKAWEQRMTGVENFTTRATRTDTQPLTKKTNTYVGEAAFMKPNLARIDLTHQDELGKKDSEKVNFERMICNGQYIYEYSPKDKLIVIHELPKGGRDPAADNMILAFLRGMKAEDAQKRFALTLTKETEWYGYVYIQPKTESDKQEFAAAQLTIYVKNPNPASAPNLAMLPCRLWYRQPNGKEVTYIFSDMQPNGKVDKESFVPRKIEGYTVKAASAPAAPMSPLPPKKTPTAVRPQMP
jgi:TIGR03009 family protein